VSEWVRVEDIDFLPGCQTWQKRVSDGYLTVIVGREPAGWHLSISHRTNHHPPRPGRNPRWNEIKDARYRFTPDAVSMCMILPPSAEYVNVHETTFHLHEHRD
jgi:hypothetical protein